MRLDVTDPNAPLARLRQAGQHPERSLLAQVKALGPAVVGPLVEMATDRRLHEAETASPEVWAPLHAIQLLGELGAPEAVEPLLSLFAWDDDWLAEALPECFGRIGGPALGPLRALLLDRAQDKWTAGRAAAGLRQIAERHPELRAEVVAALVARLDPQETRTPDDETVNAFVIAELGELKAAEAGLVIRRAFAEDRVDVRVAGPADVRADLGLSVGPSGAGADEADGMRLWLRCTACGYERPHDVGRLYCDLGTLERRRRGEQTPYDEYVITRRIICPKCGAEDHYELAGEAYLALTAELLKLGVGGAQEFRRAGDPAAGPLTFMRFGLRDGQEMHPYAARDLYRQQVMAEPTRADLRVSYANVLRFLGYREEAVSEYRVGLELDPANIEACLNLGNLAYEDGDREEARRWFERTLDLAPSSHLPVEQRQNYREFARAALAELDGPPGVGRRPKGPTRPLTLGPAWIQPRPTTARQPGRAASKVGRNAPCPCGSGRKYKRCCGR
jgi:tetratricopeptide (TPR) repeat protein